MLVIVFSIYTATMISTSWTTKGHVISKGVESYKVTCYFRVIPAQYFQLVASIELGGKFEKSCIRGLKKCATLQRFVETTSSFNFESVLLLSCILPPYHVCIAKCELSVAMKSGEHFRLYIHSDRGVLVLGSLLATLH